jgi:DNA-binding MarR family transcriptional regulator
MFYLRDLPNYEAFKKRAERYPNVDPAALESCINLLRVAVDVLAAWDVYLARHKTSAGRFSILMLLNREPEKPVSPSDLAARAGVTRATVTGLLDSLEREKLIKREHAVDDRRMIQVRLTPAARKRLDAMLPDYYKRVADLMGQLTEEEKKSLIQLLTKINAGIPTITAE